MKNVMIILASILFSMSLFANDLSFNIKAVEKEKAVIIDASGFVFNSFTLIISDDKGNILTSNEYKNPENFKIKLNLKNLSNGTYKAAFKSDFDLSIYTLNVDYDEIEISDKVEKAYKPSITTSENRVSVNAITFGDMIKVIFYNDKWEKIASYSFKDEETLNKAFNTSSFSKGKYFCIVETNHFSEQAIFVRK